MIDQGFGHWAPNCLFVTITNTLILSPCFLPFVFPLSYRCPKHPLVQDLLVSTPLSAAPLSSITSGAAQPESFPPATASLSASLSSSLAHPTSSSPPSALAGHNNRSGTSSPGTSPPRGRSAAAHATVVGWGKEDGGEWEREGLGKGLEERLEEVLAAEKARNDQTHYSPTR